MSDNTNEDIVLCNEGVKGLKESTSSAEVKDNEIKLRRKNGSLNSSVLCAATVLAFLAFITAAASVAVVFFFNLHTGTDGQIAEARRQTTEEIEALNRSILAEIEQNNNLLNRQLDVHDQFFQSQQLQLLQLKSVQEALKESLNNTVQLMNLKFDQQKQQFEEHQANAQQTHTLLDQTIASESQILSQQLDSYNQQFQANIQSLNMSIKEIENRATREHECPGSGWRHVLLFDLSRQGSVACPHPFSLTSYSGVRVCGKSLTNVGRTGCEWFSLLWDGGYFSEVCGRIKAYQYGAAHLGAFFGYYNYGHALPNQYLDGVSIMAADSTPEYRHVWSFASGFFAGVSADQGNSETVRCPCDPGNPFSSPPFVGDNYFCDSVNYNYNDQYGGFYPDNALWDGVDSLNSCYNDRGVPWFVRTMPDAHYSSPALHICTGNDHREYHIHQLQLYVR